jgi:hypothetical protein
MNQPVSVVSKAVCPANVRHSVALGRTAQQRRLFIMLSARLAQNSSRFCARYMPALEMHTAIVRFVKICFSLFLVSDGIFLCAALYNQLLLLNKLFIFALLSVLLAIALTCLLFDEVVERCKSVSQKSQHFMRASITQPEYMWSQVPASQWGEYTPPAQMSVVSTSQYFPETPQPTPSQSFSRHMQDEVSAGVDIPPTPLVRVWETIDLSSTNIEHFLDAEAQALFFPQTPGNSRMGSAREGGSGLS